jgi:hypothetical protein
MNNFLAEHVRAAVEYSQSPWNESGGLHLSTSNNVKLPTISIPEFDSKYDRQVT